MTKNHPFHMVDKSPWPILGSLGALIMFSGIIKWFHLNNNNRLLMGLTITLMIMIQWWRDIIRESTYQGHHTKSVSSNMRWGMILFIVSEIFFFISFLWGFFHSSLVPSIELGMNWPPMGVKPFNPLEIPLLNTIILLTSNFILLYIFQNNIILYISIFVYGFMFNMMEMMTNFHLQLMSKYF